MVRFPANYYRPIGVATSFGSQLGKNVNQAHTRPFFGALSDDPDDALISSSSALCGWKRCNTFMHKATATTRITMRMTVLAF